MVEATMVLPLAILIMAGLIGLMMTFYTDLAEQTGAYESRRQELYQLAETNVIRLHDRLLDAGKEVSEA
ncbi:MAG: hypothetical protein ACI4WY_13085 [Anaerovoracaceae bacterium]